MGDSLASLPSLKTKFGAVWWNFPSMQKIGFVVIDGRGV